MIITSKFDSSCKGCGVMTKVGERVQYTPGVKGVKCLQCVANGLTGGGPAPQPGTWGAQTRSSRSFWSSNPPLPKSPSFKQHFQGSWKVVSPQPPPVVRQAPTAQSQNTLAFAALVALEAVILEMPTSAAANPEMDKAWERYQKLKALALNPGTPGEERAALKQAVLTAVKLAF